MLKLEKDKMRNAIERAKAVHPRVRAISVDNREYTVSGSNGNTYTVKFVVIGRNKLAECDCAARGLCFHIAAASAVNMGLQGMREPARMKDFISRNVGWTL